MFFKMNYMSMGIGRHDIIRRDITTKLYIVHYGYVIEVIVQYCDNTSKTELDTAGVRYFRYNCKMNNSQYQMLHMSIIQNNFLNAMCAKISPGLFLLFRLS